MYMCMCNTHINIRQTIAIDERSADHLFIMDPPNNKNRSSDNIGKTRL